MTSSSPAYSIVIAQDKGTAVVSVHGELDAEGLAKLEAILVDVIDFQADLAVTVDAKAMSLTDPSGAQLFRRALDWARHQGGSFRVEAPSASVRRAMQMCGLADVIDIPARKQELSIVPDSSRPSPTRRPRVDARHPSCMDEITTASTRSMKRWLY